MKICRYSRIFILCFLALSVFVPIVLLSARLKHIHSAESKEYIEDLSAIKYRTDLRQLNAIEQEEGKGVKEPHLLLYKDDDFKSAVSFSSSEENSRTFEESRDVTCSGNLPERNETNHDTEEDNQQSQLEKVLPTAMGKEPSTKTMAQHDKNAHSQPQRVVDEQVKEMKDLVIRAKAYLSFTPPNSNSHFVRELKLRIKELGRAIGESIKDSDLPNSAMQRMRAMEAFLLKASRIYPDCSAMTKKLRAMTYNAEEQVRTHKNQATFLLQLAGRTTPKGLHCLSMRLTAEYFALQPEERGFPNQHKLHDPDLYHFAVFSDNVLACAVVVNSTISAAMEPEKIVFHIVADSLNLPAISMWFLLNRPGEATIQIQSTNNFEWLSAKNNVALQKQNFLDPRYTSALNHLRFYLPDVFPLLNKIVLLDHDVVVQRDLTGLWGVDMRSKVNAVVETCQEGEPSFRRMDIFINFSDPMVAKRFDAKACTWAFGMNVFDLQEWRRQDLTGVYHKYLKLGNKKPLWKAGSLPLGWVTFYNQTVALDQKWHVLGLGYDSAVRDGEIKQAAVIHYDGIMKPWLDIGVEKYRRYWRKHVDYDHPYLQQCNIR